VQSTFLNLDYGRELVSELCIIHYPHMLLKAYTIVSYYCHWRDPENLRDIVMMGWCVVAEHLVICVLPNLRMGDHNLTAMLDGIGHHLGSLRPVYHFGGFWVSML
jgi:hypothetical protein